MLSFTNRIVSTTPDVPVTTMPVPPEATLFRLEEAEDGTFGTLSLHFQDGPFCATLEPPDLANQAFIPGEQRGSNIPPGRYSCHPYSSSSYPHTWEITDVPGRTYILFHPGNVPSHTQGCIILGQYFGKLRGQRAVHNSGATFSRFLSAVKKATSAMKQPSFFLHIVEV